jgi:hypothetical protein
MAGPADVEVAITQYRSDRPGRLLAVEIHNLSPGTLRVAGVALRTAVLPTVPAYEGREVSIPAGATRAVRLALGDPACPSPAADGGAASGVEVTIELGGSLPPLVIAAEDPYGTLARISAEDCATEAVLAVVRLTGTSVAIDGVAGTSTARLTVLIEPSGGTGVVDLRSVEPTVLLSPQQGSGWPLDLRVTGADAPRSVELTLVPTRCDPHVIAEDKVGTRLTVVAAMADGTLQRFPLLLEDGVKEQLLAFVAEHCGL